MIIKFNNSEMRIYRCDNLNNKFTKGIILWILLINKKHRKGIPFKITRREKKNELILIKIILKIGIVR